MIIMMLVQTRDNNAPSTRLLVPDARRPCARPHTRRWCWRCWRCWWWPAGGLGGGGPGPITVHRPYAPRGCSLLCDRCHCSRPNARPATGSLRYLATRPATCGATIMCVPPATRPWRRPSDKQRAGPPSRRDHGGECASERAPPAGARLHARPCSARRAGGRAARRGIGDRVAREARVAAVLYPFSNTNFASKYSRIQHANFRRSQRWLRYTETTRHLHPHLLQDPRFH